MFFFGVVVTDPPVSPRRAGKSRPKTVPVNPTDVERAQEKNTPSTLKRRGTAPLPKPPGNLCTSNSLRIKCNKFCFCIKLVAKQRKQHLPEIYGKVTFFRL